MTLVEAHKIMPRSRAAYILANTELGGSYRYAFKRECDYAPTIHEDGITRAEDAVILAVWEQMPGWTTYEHALYRIARGHDE